MRTKTTATALAALMAICDHTGCDGGTAEPSDSGIEADGGVIGDDGGGPGTDGSMPPPPPPPPPPPAEGCGGDVAAVAHRLVSVDRVRTGRAHFGAIQRGHGRLVSFGEHLSPSLARLPYLELTEEGATARSVAVAGDVPAGQIYATVWHPGLDRFVLLTLDRDPFRYALHTMALDGATATFAELGQVDPPDGDGAIFGWVYAAGADQLVLDRGNETYTVQIAGDTATWSGPSPATTTRPTTTTADPRGGRALGFGATDFDPATGGFTFRPAIFERTLPGGAWTERPAAGGDVPEAVTNDTGIADAWIAYDATADRLLVTLSREVFDEIFGETVYQTGLWAVDLATGQWQVLQDPFYENAFSYGSAWAVDDVHHRALELGLNGLTALGTDGDSLGAVEALALDGHPGPRRTHAATALNDGRVVALSGGELLVYDPAAAAPRWARLGGDLELPRDVQHGASLDVDPRTGDLWLFGGASTNASASMGRVLRIAADGSGFTEEDTTGAPEGRTWHATVVHDGELFVAGGATSLEARDDVWALDLDARTWRRVATLPSPRWRSAARMVDGALWVVGGFAGDIGTGDVVSIDPASGEVRTLTVTGEWPPRRGIFHGAVPFGGGIVTFDLNDDTLDSDAVSLHYLAPDGDGARWQDLGSCLLDWHVESVVGAAVSEQRAFMVGPNVFELTEP